MRLLENKKLNFGFVTYEFPHYSSPGGIGTYTKQTAEMLADTFNIYVFCGGNDFCKKTLLVNGDIRYTVYIIKCKTPEQFQIEVVKLIEEIQDDVNLNIIECPEINGNGLLIKKRLPHIALVVRLHGPNHLVESLKKTYYPYISKIRYTFGCIIKGKFDFKRLTSYSYKDDIDYQTTMCADAICAPSNSMRNWAANAWNIPKNRISVIPNYYSQVGDVTSVVIEKNHVLFFGRLNAVKGVVNLTKAMKKVLQKNHHWKLVIVGEDSSFFSGISFRDWMSAQFRSISERIVFYDALPTQELTQLIKESKIVVLPSLFESFSYACLEAMFLEKPIVGSTVGGMSELLEHKKSGYLVNPYSIKKIERAISDLITNDTLRDCLGKNAKLNSAKYYSQELKEQYISFYNTVYSSVGKN